MTGCSNKFAVNLTWQMCQPAPDQRPKIPESGLETWLVALGNKPARFMAAQACRHNVCRFTSGPVSGVGGHAAVSCGVASVSTVRLRRIHDGSAVVVKWVPAPKGGRIFRWVCARLQWCVANVTCMPHMGVVACAHVVYKS
jgi:hypothetical protein